MEEKTEESVQVEERTIDGMSESEYKEKLKLKLTLEAEAKAEVEKELQTKLDVDYKALKSRKPSPEEICMKTHPKILCRVLSLEIMANDPNPSRIEFTWGGVRQSFESGTELELPLGLIDHLQNECSYPRRKLKKLPNGEQITVVDGRINRYAVTVLDTSKYAEALEQVREKGYIPVLERK